MWLYVQTWFPLLSISLTAAICFGVASFVMGQEKSGTGHFDNSSSGPFRNRLKHHRNSFGPHALGGSLMTIQIDQNRHPGFLQSGQLTLFGAAIIVLLIFAWSYAQ